MGKRGKRTRKTMTIVNAGINGNPAGFKFYTVKKCLSYTEKPVLILVPPCNFEEIKDNDTPFENKYHKISTQISLIKGIREFFLERAMELQTPETIGNCCIDVVYGLLLGIPGITEITEEAANAGSGFDSVMSLNCEVQQLKK